MSRPRGLIPFVPAPARARLRCTVMCVFTILLSPGGGPTTARCACCYTERGSPTRVAVRRSSAKRSTTGAAGFGGFCLAALIASSRPTGRPGGRPVQRRDHGGARAVAARQSPRRGPRDALAPGVALRWDLPRLPRLGHGGELGRPINSVGARRHRRDWLERDRVERERRGVGPDLRSRRTGRRRGD